MKMRMLPVAAAAPVWHAHCFPNHPGGSSGLSRTMRRWSSVATLRAIPAVSSLEWSLTITTWKSGYSDPSIDRKQSAMFLDSFRAGTITETRGGSSGGSADSSSRKVERLIRSVAITGVTIQGIVAMSATSTGVIRIDTPERYGKVGYDTEARPSDAPL